MKKRMSVYLSKNFCEHPFYQIKEGDDSLQCLLTLKLSNLTFKGTQDFIGQSLNELQ